MTANILTAIAIALLSLAAAYIFTPPGRHRKAYSLMVLLSVLARLCIIFYIYRNGTDTFGTDGLLYHQQGIKVASELAAGASVFRVGYEFTWYTVFVGLIYFIFGINRYFVSYFNIIFALISGLVLLRLALNHKYRFTNAAIISLAFLFFPNLVLWTADSRKEALLILACFLGWLSLQGFIASVRSQGSITANLFRIAFICLLMWFSTLIRIYMFIPLFLGVAASQIILYLKTRSRLCIALLAASAICALLIFISVMMPLTDNYHAVTFSSNQSDNIIQDVNNKAAVIESIASKRNMLESIFDYLILPLPGNIDISDIKDSPRAQLLVKLDMALWYVCLILVLTGIYTTLKSRDSFFIGLLAFIAAYVLINALVVENVSDTIYRYRSVIVGLVILFIDGNVIRDIFRRIRSLFRSGAHGSWTFRHNKAA